MTAWPLMKLASAVNTPSTFCKTDSTVRAQNGQTMPSTFSATVRVWVAAEAPKESNTTTHRTTSQRLDNVQPDMISSSNASAPSK